MLFQFITFIPGPTRQRPQVEMLNANISMRLERRITIMSFVMAAMFFMAWTPYAISVLVLRVNGNVPVWLFTCAALLGKSSTLYNPIIYMIFMEEFRERCKKLFGWRTNRVEESEREEIEMEEY